MFNNCHRLNYLPSLGGVIITFSLCVIASGCTAYRPTVAPGVIPTSRPPTPDDERYGHEILNGLSRKFPLEYNDPRLSKVQEIVDRLTQAAGADKEPWHIYLFKDAKFKNAAATRGNHVFVWTGMLDEVKSDDELATVLAHEISHVLARHTDPDPNEELKRLAVGIGAMAAGIAVSAAVKDPYWGQQAGRLTSGLTQQVGHGLAVNPFSRELEYEADQIGLFLMTRAGFDPQGAISFWSRAKNDIDFSNGLTFFSTHPPAEERLSRLTALLPQATGQYIPLDSVMDSSSGAIANDDPSERFAVAQLPETSLNRLQRYRVVSNRSFLHATANRGSRKIGEFSRGAEVLVVGQKPDGWLEIVDPDPGFLLSQDLVAVDPYPLGFRQ